MFFKFDMEWGNSEKFIIVDGGDRTHDPKTHGLSTTPFVKVLVGYFSPFDLLQKVNQ